MNKKYYQTFVVESPFQFPVDMLRYDCCFPDSETDSGLITDSISNSQRNVRVTIGRFISVKSDQPTIRRWESFNCKITDIHVRR